MAATARAQAKDNKFCLPIMKSSRTEVQNILRDNQAKFRYFEIWLDYIEGIEPATVTSWVGSYPNKLVVVFRRQKLEAIKMAPELRYEFVRSLARKPALVDLDIGLQTDEITRLQADRLAVKTILSYHNYSFTPSDTELRSIAQRMQGWKAHISKIATFCKNQRDSLRLLELLIELREAGQRSIVLGMGPHSAVTRVFGTLWGNEMVFTPKSLEEKSAAGQITRDKLETILQALS